jgi:excisionase family DNA binding protein
LTTNQPEEDQVVAETGHRTLMTLAAAAAYADVHPVTLRRWVAAGRLPAHRVGPRLLKFDRDELESIVRSIPVTSVRPK